MKTTARRRLSILGAATAGIVGVTALTGAASASAATVTDTDRPPSSSAPSAPARPAPSSTATPKAPADDDGKASDTTTVRADRDSRLPSWAHGDRALYRAGQAVLAAYPKATVTDVVRSGDGYRVSVTIDGRSAWVKVSADRSVGRLVVERRSHR